MVASVQYRRQMAKRFMALGGTMTFHQFQKIMGRFKDVDAVIKELRQHGIKGKRRSQDDNPIANLLLYLMLDDVKYVQLHGRGYSFTGVVPGKDFQGFLPEAMHKFWVKFNAGKYPEFEE